LCFLLFWGILKNRSLEGKVRMRDISHGRLALAAAEARKQIERIPRGDPRMFRQKREEALEKVIGNFLRVSASEPIFRALKEHLDRATSRPG